MQFKKKDDFDGFCEWCGSDRDHLREDWKIAELINTMQICMDDINKLPADALRPLLRKQNEVLIPQTLKKIESYIKGGHQLTRKKTEEFMYGKMLPQQERKFVMCANCGIHTTQPIPLGGLNFCSKKCSLNVDEIKTRLSKLSQPSRTEKKEYKPPLTYEERKELMHPKVSKMEDAIRLRLEEAKIPFQAQHEFCVQTTTPDFYFPEKDLAVYLDGEHVHMKREAKDEVLREKLQKRHGIKSVGIVYKDNSKKTEDEIWQEILGAVKEDAEK